MNGLLDRTSRGRGRSAGSLGDDQEVELSETIGGVVLVDKLGLVEGDGGAHEIDTSLIVEDAASNNLVAWLTENR